MANPWKSRRSPVGIRHQRHGSPVSTRVWLFSKDLSTSPETEGRKDDSLSAERRGLPLATATAAITLEASLRSKNIRTIN